jgi:hypothetical protein
MADNDFPQRPQRASQPPMRSAPAAAPQSMSSNDPLAELARLIGQTDPFAEYGRDSARQAAAPAGNLRQQVHEPAAASAFDDTHFAAAQTGAPPQQLGAQDYSETPYHPSDPYTQGPAPGYGAEGGHSDFEGGPYYPNVAQEGTEDDHFYDEVQPRRRVGILAGALVFALVLMGVGGAFGYRALFGASAPSGPPPVIKADATPSKVVPAQDKDAKSGKLIYDRVANGPQNEKLVSREEQPVDIAKDQPVGAVFPQSSGAATSGTIAQAAMGSGVVGVEPKKIHTIAIRPDQLPNGTPPATAPASKPAPKPPTQAQVAPKPAQQVAEASPPQRVARAEPATQRAASAGNAPLSLNPDAAPTRAPQRAHSAPAPTQTATATAAAPTGNGHYAVQVASRRSEADAQASLHSLQAKYPQQLGGQPPLIRRVDLGAKGVYYRAMVGPFGSAEQASQVCSSLKSAGGNCLIQKI